MNVYEVTFGGYLAKILSFKTGNLLNSKFHLLSEGTVECSLKDKKLGNNSRKLKTQGKTSKLKLKDVCSG